MPRFFAFLRAINIGGHVVKMDRLRQLFESLDFSHVETYIASGKVIFVTGLLDSHALEDRIEGRLKEALGYAVPTFIRTPQELAAIAIYQPFPPAQFAAAAAYNVAFLKQPLDQPSQFKLQALRTELDDFRVHQRELYWLCRVRQSQSKFSNAVLEKTTSQSSTLRGMNTILKLVERYPA